MGKENLIEEKALQFAVRIVNLYKYLRSEKKEYSLSDQILRSGTSIGANLAEAQGAQSDADFIAKLHISYKEAFETEFWITLLLKTDYISENEAKSLKQDLTIIKIMLVKILKHKKDKFYHH